MSCVEILERQHHEEVSIASPMFPQLPQQLVAEERQPTIR